MLDKQLRDNIKEFSEVKNIVAPAYSSRQLKENLEQGKRLIITTIQKFPFIVDGIADLSDHRFAVIIDEAHSSQSGTSAGKMNQAMGIAPDEEEEEDVQVKIAIAFSGKKIVDGIECTEAGLNGFAEKDTHDKFDGDEYRLLVVANKYLTGFDQPKLCTMYVDKKLQGVLAVQALSRLNRSAPNLGKKTEDLFILDFFNQVSDIKTAFDEFYTATSLTQATDVNVLHELKDALDEVGVYEAAEVDNFVEKYFAGVDAQQLSPIIDVAANRFNHELDLEHEEKADFKIKAKQFVKIYGQMAAILPYEVVAWEKLFWFLKFLIPKLMVKTTEDDLIDELLESVDLSTYGLERTKLNVAIALDEADTALDPQNPNPRSAHGGEGEKDPLDEIIRTFNERWFHGWDATPEDQRIKFLSLSKHVQAHPDYQTKVANNQDSQNSDLAFKKILDEVMSQQRRQELELYKLYAKDEAFQQAFFDTMKRMAENLT